MSVRASLLRCIAAQVWAHCIHFYFGPTPPTGYSLNLQHLYYLICGGLSPVGGIDPKILCECRVAFVILHCFARHYKRWGSRADQDTAGLLESSLGAEVMPCVHMDIACAPLALVGLACAWRPVSVCLELKAPAGDGLSPGLLSCCALGLVAGSGKSGAQGPLLSAALGVVWSLGLLTMCLSALDLQFSN